MIRSEDRLAVVASYYGLPFEVLLTIANLGKEARRPLCAQHGVSPSIIRTMADYSRYPQADDIARLLRKSGEEVSSLSFLDYGCLVADYAIYFARMGADVAVYDETNVVDFVSHRFSAEQLSVQSFILPTPGEEMMSGRDVVIFGEVLEHIENPLAPIQECIDGGVRYIFTSCYPFGDDEYFSLSGHLESAQALQPDCIRLLSQHYDAQPTRDKAVLWRRTPTVVEPKPLREPRMSIPAE